MVFRKSLCIIVFSLFALLFAHQASPQTNCTQEGQIRLYLQEKHYSGPQAVLAFDHQTQQWTAYTWKDGSLIPINPPDFEPAFTNKPRLYLKKGTQPIILVVNTDPLLFTTSFSGATEAPTTDLANLQKLAGLLGGVVSAKVALLPPDFEPRAAGKALEAIRVTMAAPNAQQQADAKLWEPVKSILDSLKEPTEEISKALGNLKKPSGDLEAQLQTINSVNAEIKNYLQMIESQSPVSIEPRPSFDQLTVSQSQLVKVETSFAEIESAGKSLQQVKPVCPDTLTSLRDAALLFRTPLPENKLPEKRAAVDAFLKALESIEKDPGCSELLNGPVLKIKDILIELHRDGTGPPSAQGATSAQDKALRPLVQGLNTYLAQVEQRSAALKATNDLMTKRGDSAKVAGAVDATLQRRKSHFRSNDLCSLVAGVLEVTRPGAKDTDLRWTQVRSESFKIVADSPFKDLVTLNHPADVTAGYELQQAGRWDFDVDVATTYTEVSEPEFSAIDADNNATTPLVISQTGEKGRAGELGMFVSFQRRMATRSQLSFGPQLGAGFSTDHPALFAGFGLGISRYFKLGFGWTWQRVKELNGSIGDPVAKTEDIKTRDDFDDNYYISLSITLDELPFFKAPEK